MTQNPGNPPKDPSDVDWFKKLFPQQFGPAPTPAPTPPEEEPNWERLFTDGASANTPAELPSSQRVAIAQMSAQFTELQRVGFSRREAFELVQSQLVAAVQVAGQQRFRRGQGGA